MTRTNRATTFVLVSVPIAAAVVLVTLATSFLLASPRAAHATTPAVELGKKPQPGDKPCGLHGKVKFVSAFADYKVKIVSAFPDIKVQKVSAFPDKPGKWQVVDAFPDFTVQIVDAFPDIKVQYVDAFPGCP